MTPALAPGAEPPIAQRSLGELTRAIASDAVAPGAGTASGVALALAAACAAKAVAITLKHRPHDARLEALRAALAAFAERALEGGDEDARRFADFMRDESPASAAALLEAGERLQRSAAALNGVLERLAAEVDPVVLADVLAARALCAACRAIQSQNLAANEANVAARAPG
jgi:formiminotetrahydrofolate cyclodeaminase